MMFSTSHICWLVKSLIFFLLFSKKHGIRVFFFLFAFVHFKISKWPINIILTFWWVIFLEIKVVEVIVCIFLSFFTYFAHLFILKRVNYWFTLLLKLILIKQVNLLMTALSSLLIWLILLFVLLFIHFVVVIDNILISLRLMDRVVSTTSCSSLTILMKLMSTAAEVLFFYLLLINL